METIESLSRKIKTAKDLQSVVRTMKALAAVNIRQYEKAAESISGYYRTVELGLQVLLKNRPQILSEIKPSPLAPLGAVIFGTDQGLCGPFNDIIVNYALTGMERLGAGNAEGTVLSVGFRVAGRLEDAGNRTEKLISLPGSIPGITAVVQEILLTIEEWHSQGRVTSVFLFYNGHRAGSTYQPRSFRLLPLDIDWLRNLERGKWPARNLPTFTMDWNLLFSSLSREYLFASIYRALAESLASENATRLASMQNAEKSIEERLVEFTSEFHRQRQMSITEELLDIVAGFEALRQFRD